MNNGTDKLQIVVNLGFPVLNANTIEISRAENLFSLIAKKANKKFVTMGFKDVPNPPFLRSVASDTQSKKMQGTIIFDPLFFERHRANPETLPGLKASLNILEEEGINYVIAGRETLNEEFVYHIDMPPMDIKEVIELLETCEGFLDKGSLFTVNERKVIANNALGLSYSQMKNVFTYCSWLKHKGENYLDEIRKEKAHILRDVGLDVMPALNIDDVGGLENLKDFLQIRKAGWDKDLPVKGVLMAGVPGCGKTLSAKAIAGYLGTTLVRLDLSRFYNKYIGETERQFNRALQTIEEIAPVVVMIDEMEKFFGNGDGEHEVSKRLLGSFLYWLQERKNKIFIVATANRIQSLPPELMRAGRWDRTFFIDLPNREEREKIFEIHLKKQGAAMSNFDIEALLIASDGHTGAEIEQAVTDGLYLANAENIPLNNQIMLRCVNDITPTSETRRDDIEKIRALKAQGFYPANNYEKEATNNQDSSNRRIITD